MASGGASGPVASVAGRALEEVTHARGTRPESGIPETRWVATLPASDLALLDRGCHAQFSRLGTDVSVALCLGAWVPVSQATSRLECQSFSGTDQCRTLDVVERTRVLATFVDAFSGDQPAASLASPHATGRIRFADPRASSARRGTVSGGAGYTGREYQTGRKRTWPPSRLSSDGTNTLPRSSEKPKSSSGIEKTDVASSTIQETILHPC